MGPITTKFQNTLGSAWEKHKEDPWAYLQVVGTVVLQFISLWEQIMIKTVGRIAVLEQQVGVAPQQPGAPAPSAAPAPVGRRPGGNLVRLGGDGQPLSAEEQAQEEEADLKIYGEIDASRYAPRGAATPTTPAGAMPPAPPPNGSAPPAQG